MVPHPASLLQHSWKQLTLSLLHLFSFLQSRWILLLISDKLSEQIPSLHLDPPATFTHKHSVFRQIHTHIPGSSLGRWYVYLKGIQLEAVSWS